MFHVKHRTNSTPRSEPRPSAPCRCCTRPTSRCAARRSAGCSPSPTRRAASARPRPRSTWRPRWPCKDSGRSSSISIRRATRAPRWASPTGTPGRRRRTKCSSARCRCRTALRQSPHSERLFCVPATIDLAGAEIELVSMVARENRLRTALAELDDVRLRLRLHRLPAVARAADHQRVGRRAGGADPDPVRVLRAGGGGQLLSNIEMVKAHLNPRPGRHAPSSSRCTTAGPSSPTRWPTRSAGTSAQGVAHGDPAQRQGLRGAGLRHDDHRLRSRFARRDELPRRQPRTRRARPTGIREGDDHDAAVTRRRAASAAAWPR